MIDTFAASLTVRAIGWALLQSLWQGALIGAVTAWVLMALRRGAATRRHVVACAGLFAIAAVSMVTAVGHARALRTTSRHQDFAAPSVFATTDTRGRAVVPDTMSHGDPSRQPAPATASRWPRERLEAWSVIAVPLWLIGVLALSSRLVASWFIVERIKRAAQRPVSKAWRIRANTLADRLRVSRPFQIVESAVVNVPMVIGWLRPVILLPGAALTGLSPGQLEAVIAHELGHIRRHDYVINVLQTTVETLLFYHPASWWISHRIRVEREHCCDDVAVELCGDRVLYARALADLDELRTADVAFGLAATGGPLMRRIHRLLGLSSTDRDHAPTWMVVGALLTALTFALMSEQVTIARRPGPALLEFAAGAAPTVETTLSPEAVVRGRITDARSGRPLAQATVELSGNGQQATTSTDDDGRYEVRTSQQGECHVFVRATGYVPALYGQRVAAEDGISLEVRGGQITSGVDVRLQPAGVINGRIFADSGEGLPGVEIQLISDRYLPGGTVPVAVAFAQAEATGVFRVGELEPGEYYVRAYVPPTVRPSRGEGTLVYAPTYFPQATRMGEAQPVLVGAGQELFDVNVTLVTVGTHVVTGTLIDPTGPPLAQAKVVMMPDRGDGALAPQTVPVSPDGRFQIQHVAPGDYRLMVQDSVDTVRWFATRQRVTVDGDLSGVDLIARRGARLDGRVVREGGDALPFDPHTIQVTVEQRTERQPGIWDGVRVHGVKVTPDGTFSTESPAGSSYLTVSGLPANWTVKAIRLEGSDITDQTTDFGDGVPRHVEIVLTDRVSDIVGVVTDQNYRAILNYTVVVFPEDRDRWGASSRLVRAARPRQDGSYQIDALPPADYVAVAVESLPRNAWTDPHVLERLRPLATPFRLREGEQRTVQLKLSLTPKGLLAEY
jgi:beta-lactamase regulating signal transducer with metallopeptidase domain